MSIHLILQLLWQEWLAAEKTPLIRLDADQFKWIELKEGFELDKFQALHNLCPGEPNVFVEVEWSVAEKNIEKAIEVILTDKVGKK